ncbi:NCL [Symbiodinium sp. CCMP2592]|nr:NCL [Symbiodinium sp. CCMP2592]
MLPTLLGTQTRVSEKRRPCALELPSPGSASEHPMASPMASRASRACESPEARSQYTTPPQRGSVDVIFFDFDGTLTSTAGDRASRCSKPRELCERAAMLEPRLQALCSQGISLGIISKSTEAVGFEGKAGFIEDLALKGRLPTSGSMSGRRVPLHRILLVDDDLTELDTAKARGLQVYAAPAIGGLQEEDFDVISLLKVGEHDEEALDEESLLIPKGEVEEDLVPERPREKQVGLLERCCRRCFFN